MRHQYSGIILILLFVPAALGDGCYIAERAVRRIPEIPAQRAVLAWKDGTETLVIASSLDSEAQRLGWLIPIPAVPQTIEKETPGALTTLGFCLQPKITHDLHRETVGVVLAVLLGNLLLGTALFNRRRLPHLLFVLVFLFCLSALLLPAVGPGGEAFLKTSHVQVEKFATVGSYDMSILRPSTLDDLNAWLAENGFSSLPATADESVTDYIARGWVFAATKLNREERGQNTPHPIKMVFATKEAVYPMRLTAVAGGSPEFEIFVIGDDTASSDLFQNRFCDRFSQAPHAKSKQNEEEIAFVGSTTRRVIGHPAVCSLMWDGCVVTECAGKVRANDMTRDAQFEWKGFRACQQHFFTSRGARGFAFILFVALAGAWLFVSMAICKNRITQPAGLRWYFTRVLLPAIIGIPVVTMIAFVSVPTLDDSEIQVASGFGWPRHFASFLQDSIDSLLEDHPDVLQETPQEIAAYILKNVGEPRMGAKAILNPMTGGEVKADDSPGNFTVEKRGNEVVIRVYDLVGGVLVSKYATAEPATLKEDSPE